MGVGLGTRVAAGMAVGVGVGAGVEAVPSPQATATRAASSRQGSNRIFNGRIGVLWVRVVIVSEWLRREREFGRGGCRNFASVYNSPKNIPKALNLSAREPRPMKAFALKDNRMNPSGIRAPQVHAEG